MISNSELDSIVNSTEVPILILVDSTDDCSGKTEKQNLLESLLEQSMVQVDFYTLCIPESSMKFPRIATPALYFFLPKNSNPVFWRGDTFLAYINRDLQIIEKMHTLGISYQEASFTDDQKKIIEKVDGFLQEEGDLAEYPSSFQMIRGFAKELWETSKRAAKGLPVLVPAAVGFERVTICESCPFYRPKEERCSKCGCLIRTKSQLVNSECPDGRWGKHTA